MVVTSLLYCFVSFIVLSQDSTKYPSFNLFGYTVDLAKICWLFSVISEHVGPLVLLYCNCIVILSMLWSILQLNQNGRSAILNHILNFGTSYFFIYFF